MAAQAGHDFYVEDGRYQCPHPDCDATWATRGSGRSTVLKHILQKHRGEEGDALWLSLDDLAGFGILECPAAGCAHLALGPSGLGKHLHRTDDDAHRAARPAWAAARSGARRRVPGANPPAAAAPPGGGAGARRVRFAPQGGGGDPDSSDDDSGRGEYGDGFVVGGIGIQPAWATTPFPSLEAISRLPHSLSVPKSLRRQWDAALSRVCTALSETPTSAEAWAHFFGLPKLALCRYRGKKWQRHAKKALRTYPVMSVSDVARVEAWRPRNRGADNGPPVPLGAVLVDDSDTSSDEEEDERSIEARVRRALSKAKSGSLQKAAKAIWGEKALRTTDAVFRALEEKHPAGPEIGDGNISVLPDAAVLSENDVVTGVRKLPRASSPGPSGWTYELIQRPFLEVSRNDDAVAATLLVTQFLVSGQCPLSDWWHACRLIPLDKGKGKVRPVAVGGAWYRLAARLLLAHAGVDVKACVPDWQFAVMCRGGCEPVVHLVRQAVAEGKVVVGFDFSNAFNTPKRGKMLAQLRSKGEASQRMLRMAWDVYARHTKLLVQMNDGEVRTILSQLGVRQGDPLAVLLFSCALEGALDDCDIDWTTVSRAALADDLYLFVDPGTDVDALQAEIARAVEPWGLSLNGDKTVIFDSVSLLGEGMNRIVHRVLGAFIGDEYAVAQRLEDAYSTWLVRLPWLDRLPRQVALLLLRHVVIAGVAHLPRLHPQSTVLWAALNFDAAVLRCFSRWLTAANPEDSNAGGLNLGWLDDLEAALEGAVAPVVIPAFYRDPENGADPGHVNFVEENDERLDNLWSFAFSHFEDAPAWVSGMSAPVRLGGLGIRLQHPTASFAYAASFVLSRHVLGERGVALGSVDDANTVQMISKGALTLNVTPAELLGFGATACTHLQRHMVARQEMAAFVEPLLQCIRLGREATLGNVDDVDVVNAGHNAILWAEQLAPVARGWLRALPMAGVTSLEDDAVISGAAVRCFHPSFVTPKAYCSWCAAPLGAGSVWTCWHHARTCKAAQVIRTRRHDLVRDHTAQGWRDAVPEATVRIEKRSVQAVGHNHWRGDVWVSAVGDDHVDKHIDVTVVTPDLPVRGLASGNAWPSEHDELVVIFAGAVLLGLPPAVVRRIAGLRLLREGGSDEWVPATHAFFDDLPLADVAEFMRREERVMLHGKEMDCVPKSDIVQYTRDKLADWVHDGCPSEEDDSIDSWMQTDDRLRNLLRAVLMAEAFPTGLPGDGQVENHRAVLEEFATEAGIMIGQLKRFVDTVWAPDATLRSVARKLTKAATVDSLKRAATEKEARQLLPYAMSPLGVQYKAGDARPPLQGTAGPAHDAALSCILLRGEMHLLRHFASSPPQGEGTLTRHAPAVRLPAFGAMDGDDAESYVGSVD